MFCTKVKLIFLFVLLSLQINSAYAFIKPEQQVNDAIELLHGDSSLDVAFAIEKLHFIRKNFTADEIPGDIHLLMGFAYFKLEKWKYAILHLTEAQKESALLKDYILKMLAEAKVHEGHFSDASKDWESLSKISTSPFSRDAFISNAEAKLNAGAHGHALKKASYLLSKRYLRARYRKQKPKIITIQGLALERLKRSKEAEKKLRFVLFKTCDQPAINQSLAGIYRLHGLETKPEAMWSYKDLDALFNNQQLRALAHNLYRCDFYGKSETIYSGLIKRNFRNTESQVPQITKHPHYGQVYFNLGRAHYRLRNFEEALRIFQNFVEKTNSKKSYVKKLKRDALYWAGQSAQRLDLRDLSRYYNHEFIKQYPKDRRVDDALYQIGLTFYFDQNYVRTHLTLDEFSKKHPKSKYNLDAAWYRGWSLFRLERYESAIEVWKNLTYRKTKRSDHRIRSKYWIARCYEELSDREDAIKLYSKIVDESPYHYYGHASRVRLSQMGQDVEPQHPLSGISLSALGDPLVKKLNAEYIEKKPYNQYWQRALRLHELGFNQWASNELFRVQRKSRGSQKLFELALLYRGLGDYNRSAYIARVHFHPMLTSRGKLEDTSKVDKPNRIAIWSMAYPQAWKDTVENTADEIKVNRSFIWSIMRQESNFRKKAKSTANAHGLMQLLPRTAAAMAGNEVSKEELFDPKTNILLGSRYLKYLISQFGGQLHLVTAAYNAGPERVQSWLEKRVDLPTDMFIEEIPFRETRNYVKRVLRIYHHYESLYGKTIPVKSFFKPYVS